MSWLSTSLSENLTNITGQISTFTKDMLTEGTVEVDDHETELKIAKSRVRELELTLYTQREEYDRVKELNHELQERAEAAELQITSISREYRMLLQEKESEAVQLREQLEMVKEEGQKQERLPSFSEDSFVEGTSQDEVQYLKAIVSKLQEEKIQWSKNNEKENLHKELDHYQHELATLHATYSQRIAAMNKKHKQEIEDLESSHHEALLKIHELEQQLEENVVKSRNVALENVAETESDFEIIKRDSAESDLQTLPSAAVAEESMDELKILVDRLECENRDLKEQLASLGVQNRENELEIIRLQQENKDLTEQLNHAAATQQLEQENEELAEQPHQAPRGSGNEAEIDRLQRENKELTEQRDQAVISEAQTSASLESLREELSRLGMVTMELMKEVEQSQGVEKEKSIEIESLKKVCQVRSLSEDGDSSEVLKLKDMLAVLWQKYSSVVLENEKVRLDVLNLKRRLLKQLQDRHGDTKSLLDGVNDARTKLSSQLEGQCEEVRLEKHQLISMMPGVENEVEHHEESVSRLMQKSDDNKMATKDIVNDFGRRWSVSNHVASLQAEKAVLERTIVGLEEKVQELEQLLGQRDSPRSSDSTDCVRAAPDVSEPGHERDLTPETVEGRVIVEGLGTNDVGVYEEDDNKDYDRLMEKLKEYQEMIEEFEIIKEDWEGEKEALENVVVQLRQKLKDTAQVEKNQKTEEGESGKLFKKRCLNEIEELLVKKNLASEEELRETSSLNSREDVVLSRVLGWLRNDKVEDVMMVKRENDEYFSALGVGGDEMFVDGPEDNERAAEGSMAGDEAGNEVTGTTETLEQLNEDMHELHAARGELDAARSELDSARNVCEQTKRELDETNIRLSDTSKKLDKAIVEEKRSRVDLEKTRVHLDDAKERASELETKLKRLRTELEDNQVNFNSMISEKDSQLHKLREVVEQLQGTLSNFENDKANVVSQLQQEISSLQRELRDVTSSCETIAAQLEESKQELAFALDAKNSLGLQLSETVTEKEQLLGMVNERDVKIEELQDLCDSVDQKLSFLHEEGKRDSRAFSELSEENSLLKEEKADLFTLFETKENELNNSLRESEKLSKLLREQELASEEMRRQNSELAKDLENWRVQMEELNKTKEAVNRDLDARCEEILSLKESNIELANQSYENNAEISEKLSMLEQLVSENLALKSENETLMETLSQNKISEKELKDSYNLLVQEKGQLDTMFSQKCTEMDKEILRKINDIEILRLEVARLTKESQEKDHVIRTHVSANLVSGNDNDVTTKQEHLRRILQEKDVEMDALRTKNESLLTLFAENEQEKEETRDEHEKHIVGMLQREERMLNEMNEKSDQIIALEDRLEMLNIKSASKDQASALIHAEHQKLLHLNESQSEEIGRLREKATTLGLLVAERDHSASGEVHKLRQRNSDLQMQVDALQGEQERLLMLVHEKEGQLLNIVHESPLGRTQEVVLNTPPPSDNSLEQFTRNEDEMKRLADENQKLSQEILSLRNNLASLKDSSQNESDVNRALAQQNDVINQRLRSLEAAHMDSGNDLLRLQVESEKLSEELSVKEREIMAGKEEKNQMLYEINTLKNEKDELFLEQSSKVIDLQTKLSSLLDVMCSDEGFKDEQFEILENREDFERLVSRVRSHRARVLSDKENEVRLLKEQVGTLSSVQNISNPELEARLEQFIQEKDEMNQSVLEIENEKLELLEEKENELTSLQTQVVNLSNVLKQKERQWLAEKDAFSQKNALLVKRIESLEGERDSLNESRLQTESEVLRLRDQLASLTQVNETDEKVADLEKELEGLREKHSRCVKELREVNSELGIARQRAEEFEMKKDKELERLRTHLLQVEDSYTQEALASEERENEIRHQLEHIQQQLLTSSHSLQDSNRTASMKMENLQEQLINVTAHHDEVQAQLEQSQEQTLQYMKSVENLQMVLEQFQREKESELKSLRESNQVYLNEAEREMNRLRERELELQQLLQNASDALRKADRLGEDLKSREEEIEILKQTVANLELDLQSSHDKLRRLTSNNDGKIEKGLMKNMLIAYFNASEQKRSDVVAVLGHILNFTEEEIKKVGTGSQPPQATGWFSGLLSYSGSSQTQQQHDKTFSELFVSFLEKESESQLISQSMVQPSPSGTLPSTRAITTVTAIPARLRDSPLPTSPLASSTPYGNAVAKPLLMNSRKEEVASGSNGTGQESGNALLGSSLRPSLDLPTITNTPSSSTALRQILFNN